MENKTVENMINEMIDDNKSKIAEEGSWVEILAFNVVEDICNANITTFIELVERLKDSFQRTIEEEFARNLKRLFYK